LEIGTSIIKVLFLFLLKNRRKPMSNLPVDRDKKYMYDMWGTTDLVTDYKPDTSNKRVIQEILHDTARKHNFTMQTELHEKIRNDEDYDDWEYGTEPVYGKVI
jgi:hypothetical protein